MLMVRFLLEIFLVWWLTVENSLRLLYGFHMDFAIYQDATVPVTAATPAARSEWFWRWGKNLSRSWGPVKPLGPPQVQFDYVVIPVKLTLSDSREPGTPLRKSMIWDPAAPLLKSQICYKNIVPLHIGVGYFLKNGLCFNHQLVGGFKWKNIFTPNPGEMIQFDKHIFQKGWFNHQLVNFP